MKHVSYAVAVLIASLTILVASETLADNPTKATQADTPTTKARLWNLQDADILSVINEVSLETGKNFVVDPRVSGKISLISSKAIKPDEVYQIFLSVLELLGYSAIPATGNIVKVVPNMESSEMAARVASSQAPGRGDEVVVRVIPLENVSATQVLPVLRPMLPQWSNITAYMPGNVLIIAGHAANLQKIMKVIRNIDAAANNSIEMIPLHQASASQVATVLSNLQSAARNNGDTSTISIASDERSNSILLSGNKSARVRIRALIAELDSPVSANQGNTEVIYLKYLEAKVLAPILGKIAQNILRTGATEPTAAPTPNYNNGQGTANLTGGKGKDAQPENETNIQAETNTNSLIITAAPTLMKALKVVVNKLDIRPAQVLVQAIIVEIDQEDLSNMGIQWGTKPGDHASGANPNEFPEGGALTTVRFPSLGEGTLGIIPSTQIRAILSLLANKTGVNILSTPSVVVLDNKRATVKVGQDVPFANGSYASTPGGGTVAPFTTVESKPVVLEFDVTPQINLGHSVRLKILIKNDTLQNPDNPTLNPLINTSEIHNSVIINSDDILVIGGLIRNNVTDSVDKIPILGDIPIVGALFQHKRRSLQKKNLVAFIKPVIIYNADDAMAITSMKYNAVRDAQIGWPVDLTHEGQQKMQNILPLWKNNIVLPKPFETA